MEDAKPYLCMNMGDVSLEFIKHWDIHQIMRPVVHEIMPTLQLVLSAAGESKALSSWVKLAKSKNHSMALLIIMAQIHFLCSRNSAKVQIGLRLQAWACGTSRQMINVLHQTCLTVLYPSIANMVQALADCSIERARAVSLHPHALAYDNANVSSSIFVEQGPNTMSKVQSGTFAVIYELLNACAEDMDIKPLIENLCRSSPLVIADLQMKPEAGQFYISQTAVTLVQILMKYVKGFDAQQTIQLKHSPDDLDKLAIPMLNDQLTNAQIWGGQNICQKDVSSWEQCKIFQLGFGCFHLVMNLLWQILHGLVLNAWCTECNSTSLANYAKSGPTPQDLLDCARHIIGKYAVPSTDSVFEPTSLKAPLKDLQSRVVIKRPVTDIVHNNTALLTCDLLYVMVLVDAIAYGDFGRVEDILPNIACMFRGSGSNNYSMEILHLIFNIKESLFAAKGIYSNWDCLGNIAAGINYLQLCIANKAKELELQSVVLDCDANSTAHPVVDILTAGNRKFQSSSLATFNKKLADMRQGKSSQPKADKITPCQVIEDADADEAEQLGELSALHDKLED
ncbi:hypothetical protein V8E53_005574 [Lactarius tabidus]